MVRQVDCGFESIDCRPKMDLDFLYIESPTSRLTWGVEVDSTKFVQQALLGVIEQEELVARGEVPFTQKRRNVRLLLSGAKQSLPVRDTPLVSGRRCPHCGAGGGSLDAYERKDAARAGDA